MYHRFLCVLTAHRSVDIQTQRGAIPSPEAHQELACLKV